MDWLRPILLLAGAIFMGLLIWWDRRRPRRARGGDPAWSGPRIEPARSASEAQSEREATSGALRPATAPLPAATQAASAVATPPMPEAPRPVGREQPPRAPPPAVERPPASNIPARAASGATAPPSGATPVPNPTTASEPPLVVDWPEEGARRIVSLRILPARHDRLAGRALRQGLTASGFRHGAFGIFHLPEPDGRVVLSAASLVRPGMLDPATMDFQRFAGVNLFAVLPGPVSDEQALQRLGQVAVELASRVEGQVQEESGAPFNAAAVAAWRGRCLQAIGHPRAAAGPAH
jgi:FtsZ-interacting cell division protein ZipA